MKIESKSIDFAPIELKFTIHSPMELMILFHRLNYPIKAIRSDVNYNSDLLIEDFSLAIEDTEDDISICCNDFDKNTGDIMMSLIGGNNLLNKKLKKQRN
jgi:hypothetical protein